MRMRLIADVAGGQGELAFWLAEELEDQDLQESYLDYMKN